MIVVIGMQEKQSGIQLSELGLKQRMTTKWYSLTGSKWESVFIHVGRGLSGFCGASVL